MHIAIVEDNIADRHQTERLLGREVDRRRTAEEGYYVDSFGSADAVLPCPTTYDIFFLDMQHSEPDGFQLMIQLMRRGASGYFVLMSSAIDYEQEFARSRDQVPFPMQVRFLRKPILVKELSAVLDELIPLTADKIKLVEVRGLAMDSTYYLLPDEICWAATKGSSTQIHTTRPGSESVLTSLTSVENAFDDVIDFGHFMMTDLKTYLNMHHVRKIGFLSITMDDGTRIHVGRDRIKVALMLQDKLQHDEDSQKNAEQSASLSGVQGTGAANSKSSGQSAQAIFPQDKHQHTTEE